MKIQSPRPDPLEIIRDPAALRVRLAHAIREVDTLRRLLKIAEKNASPIHGEKVGMNSE